jgi:hypothetical protein
MSVPATGRIGGIVVAVIDAVTLWRSFEAALRERGLGWALHYAPARLRHARDADHPRGASLDHLLPLDYRAFVAEVGYPVLGYGYYDREGFSFLPAEAMAGISVNLPDPDDVWPKAVEGAPTPCRYAFFAGSDLSDIEGLAFGPSAAGGEPGAAGEPVVWLVERGMPHEEVGTFTEWLHIEVEHQLARIADVGPEQAAELLAESEGETDPHRLLDYSLDGSYDQPPYSPADLELAWVERQSGSPYSYGLVDGSGAWLIPMGKLFRSVTPFRDGAARVILNQRGTSYSGPWSLIRPDGTVIGPAPGDS